MASDFSKKIDKKYHLCEGSESALINNLQILDQKRKFLSDNLRDIKEDYVLLLHNHLVNFESIATCLVDVSKD